MHSLRSAWQMATYSLFGVLKYYKIRGVCPSVWPMDRYSSLPIGEDEDNISLLLD